MNLIQLIACINPSAHVKVIYNNDWCNYDAKPS